MYECLKIKQFIGSVTAFNQREEFHKHRGLKPAHAGEVQSPSSLSHKWLPQSTNSDVITGSDTGSKKMWGRIRTSKTNTFLASRFADIHMCPCAHSLFTTQAIWLGTFNHMHDRQQQANVSTWFSPWPNSRPPFSSAVALIGTFNAWNTGPQLASPHLKSKTHQGFIIQQQQHTTAETGSQDTDTGIMWKDRETDWHPWGRCFSWVGLEKKSKKK